MSSSLSDLVDNLSEGHQNNNYVYRLHIDYISTKDNQFLGLLNAKKIRRKISINI